VGGASVSGRRHQSFVPTGSRSSADGLQMGSWKEEVTQGRLRGACVDIHPHDQSRCGTPPVHQYDSAEAAHEKIHSDKHRDLRCRS
jgi:hypothetical protein